MKHFLSIALALMVTFSFCVTSVFADTVVTATNTDTSTDHIITFADVDRNSAQGRAIYKLADAGILLGDGNGYFRPNDPISRAELSKIVNMIFEYSETATDGFADLTGNEWYYNHAFIAKKAGYIKGFEDNTFRGEANVTREQACAILCRTADLYEIPLDIQISDHISPWAVTNVKTVIANGQMSLEAGNTFRATADITRAEFCDAYANFVKTGIPSNPNELVQEGITIQDADGKHIKATVQIEGKQVTITLADTHTIANLKGIIVTVKTKGGEAVSGITVIVKDKTNATKTAVTDIQGTATIQKATDGTGTGGGGNTGGNTGTGGGGNTGGNTGTGDSGNTGGNTGTGDSGNTGGNTGTGGGGNTGGNTETPDPTPGTDPEYGEEEYRTMNAEMLTNLNDVVTRITYILDVNPVYFVPNSDEAVLLSIIRTCMEGTVNNGGIEIITKETISRDYSESIREARSLYDGLSNQAAFHDTLIQGFDDSLTEEELLAGKNSTAALSFLFTIFEINTSRA